MDERSKIFINSVKTFAELGTFEQLLQGACNIILAAAYESANREDQFDAWVEARKEDGRRISMKGSVDSS
jgi:hypothetical protein